MTNTKKKKNAYKIFGLSVQEKISSKGRSFENWTTMVVLYVFDSLKSASFVPLHWQKNTVHLHWLHCMFLIYSKESAHKIHSFENQTTLIEQYVSKSLKKDWIIRVIYFENQPTLTALYSMY